VDTHQKETSNHGHEQVADVHAAPATSVKHTLPSIVDALIRIFEARPTHPERSHPISVSRSVSILAVLYEKARNAVEFRAEHLVRRAAIERILKRRITLGGSPESIAEALALELMWAKYIDSSLVDENVTAAITRVIRRYLKVKAKLFSSSSKYLGLTWASILGLMSSEIDEMIVSPTKRGAIVNFVYQALLPKYPLEGFTERDRDMVVYIATERAFAQSDEPLILFHLLKVIHPDWFTVTDENFDSEMAAFLQNVSDIQNHLINPKVTPVSRHMKRHLPPYRIIRDMFIEKDSAIRPIVEDEALLTQELERVAGVRYKETGAKIQRAVVRSIIYIFLTKMVFALALEAPFDLFIAHKIDYIPLIINLLFPPFLLFLVAGFTSVPGKENTKRLIERIKTILYHFDTIRDEADIFHGREQQKRPILTASFGIVYFAAFGITFGAILWALAALHYNPASQVIFIFFVALVTIFAYRIRVSSKEYELVDRQGVLEPLIDFFFLPILWAGDMLSKEIAKINIFIFLFDFILEAPLKVIFEVAEEWIRFIRTKKEEIL
jgi:hypothetical protein